MYFRARYYDPQTGEFISRDPLGYVDGMSQYRAYFVPGAVDPTGFYSICDRAYKRCVTLNGLAPKYATVTEKDKTICRQERRECERRQEITTTPNPAPESYEECRAGCVTVNGWQTINLSCLADCEHRYRNRKNRCPAKRPATGVPDKEGNTWYADAPDGEDRYHGGYDCYRSKHFQCCYDCEGNVVTTGRFQGTYDEVPYDPDAWRINPYNWPSMVSHVVNDVLPHSNEENQYYDGLTQVYK